MNPDWLADVEAAQRGDQGAFSALHAEFGATVHGLLLVRVSPGEVDDLVQDVFVTAFGRIAELRNPRAFPAWLATIARRRAVDHHRRFRAAEPLIEEPPDARGDLSRTHEALEVLRVIRELPEAYVEPLVLRLVAGMSGPEIAERTGLSPGYVRVNLHRGMKQLRRRLLEGDEQDQRDGRERGSQP